MLHLARHGDYRLCVSKKRLIRQLLDCRTMPKVGGFWEHVWCVQDTWVTLRPWLLFGDNGRRLELYVEHATDGEVRSMALRSPRTRAEDRELRYAITDATCMNWSMVRVVGHFPLPWMEPLLAELTEQVYAGIQDLAAKDPRVTAALT